MKGMIASVIVAFLLVGCSTFDPSMLQASKSEISPKLLRLSYEESGKVLSVKSANTIDVNSYMYTVFKRELPNISSLSGDKKGSMDINVTYASMKPGSRGLGFISGLMLMVPNLLGMPIGSFNANLEFDASIKNLDGNEIWSHTYSGKTKKYVGLYYGRYASFRDAESILMVQLFKDQIAEMKADLQRDVGSINGQLSAAPAPAQQ